MYCGYSDFEKISSGLVGPLKRILPSYRYLLLFVDPSSNNMWGFSVKSTAEVQLLVIKFFKFCDRQFVDRLVQCYKNEQGFEFFNRKVKDHLESVSIHTERSSGFRHNENGVAECNVTLLKSMTKNVRGAAPLDVRLWRHVMFCSLKV